MDVRNRYIVTYDVANPKRLKRMHRLLSGFGDPVQYSVFCCDLSPVERAQMRKAILTLVDASADRVMIVDAGPSDGRGIHAIETIGHPLCPIGPDRRTIVV